MAPCSSSSFADCLPSAAPIVKGKVLLALPRRYSWPAPSRTTMVPFSQPLPKICRVTCCKGRKDRALSGSSRMVAFLVFDSACIEDQVRAAEAAIGMVFSRWRRSEFMSLSFPFLRNPHEEPPTVKVRIPEGVTVDAVRCNSISRNGGTRNQATSGYNVLSLRSGRRLDGNCCNRSACRIFCRREQSHSSRKFLELEFSHDLQNAGLARAL